MRKRKGDEIIFDERDRERYLLEFHNRKQQKKIDYLTKKALRDKKNRVLDRIARKRNLIRREKELGLLESEYDHPKVTTSKDMEDQFTKNQFGTDEVTVTVEYDGETAAPADEELSDAALLNDDNEMEENGSEENDLEENDLDEEEKKILDNVKLSEKELRKIREQAAAKKKKRKSRRKHK